ncbi:DsbA oxidoreductase [Paracoccus aminophilus JCM 7686]|uniref:DsbA oxidoreductase n=2 Tax=Paracoccus aminophilus TaxID=34003 RepID=S5XY66_PARAH|nr:DsbA oxidoreductase [Paracoccus aminophilus JCM 7686]
MLRALSLFLLLACAGGAVAGLWGGSPEPDAKVAISGLSQQLFNDPDAPVIGNPHGTITIVEFTDYNCSYCRKNAPELDALLSAHPELRLVIREWPIFGEESTLAAAAALAAQKQGKYPEFHALLMATYGPTSEPAIRRAALAVGLDLPQMMQDIDSPEIYAHFERSDFLAEALGIAGTPSFVIGDRVIFGYLGRGDLEEILSDGGLLTKK